MFEIISAGGGNVNTLITLAGVSEKMRNIETTKRETLQPYVMVGFMLIAITGFTTLLVIDSLTSLGAQLETEQYKKDILDADTQFIDEIGLKEHLSPTRANGLVSMIKQLKMYAIAYQTQLN